MGKVINWVNSLLQKLYDNDSTGNAIILSVIILLLHSVEVISKSYYYYYYYYYTHLMASFPGQPG